MMFSNIKDKYITGWYIKKKIESPTFMKKM